MPSRQGGGTIAGVIGGKAGGEGGETANQPSDE